MISRRPMWMLFVTCALWSSGSSAMAKAALEERAGENYIAVSQPEQLIAQAQPYEGDPVETDPDDAGSVAVERPTLSVGSSGPLVIQIQVLLQEQDLYSGTINGDFDVATADAVRQFQQEQGLEPTGKVDGSTWGPLTGEVPTEVAEAAETEEVSDGDAPVEAVEETASPSGRRLIIAAVALLGLGAGGFGLWKILAVPVPQPLDYSDESDDEDDYEYMDEPEASSQARSQRRNSQVAPDEDDSPITVPAATLVGNAAQPLSEPAEFDDGVEMETVDLPGLENIDLPDEVGSTSQGLSGAQAHSDELDEPDDESRVIQEAALQNNAVVKDATGKSLIEAQLDAKQQELRQESPTDTAVAIATQSVMAAAQEKVAAQKQPARAAKRVPNPKSASGAGAKSSLAKTIPGKARSGKSNFAKPGRAKAPVGNSSLTPPPPPPPPSEITRAAPAGAIEQPELVTTRVVRADIVETLMTDLQCADPAKRRKAIWELGQRSDSRAIQPLVNLMTSSDSRQRSLILAALSEIGTQTLKPMKQALAISLQDDNAEVRKNAIRDLTRIYDLVAQISHLLNSALDDPDTEVQDTARWALKQLNRIRSNAGLEGTSDQPMLQQSVSPPENLSGKGTFKPKSLPKVDPR